MIFFPEIANASVPNTNAFLLALKGHFILRLIHQLRIRIETGWWTHVKKRDQPEPKDLPVCDGTKPLKTQMETTMSQFEPQPCVRPFGTGFRTGFKIYYLHYSNYHEKRELSPRWKSKLKMHYHHYDKNEEHMIHPSSIRNTDNKNFSSFTDGSGISFFFYSSLFDLHYYWT